MVMRWMMFPGMVLKCLIPFSRRLHPCTRELIEHSIFTHFTIPETRTEYSTVFAEHSLYITVGGLALVRGGGGGAVLTYN